MKILLAGDSTVARCPSYEYPMSGWGNELAPFVSQWGAVYNFAKGGVSTETFRDEGLWALLLAELGQGDVVLLQFGHNDQKRSHLGPETGYRSNLERMITEVVAGGSQPVLCTPVERRNFIDGRQRLTLAAYADAVRRIGRRQQVPVIELNDWTAALYDTAGENGSIAYFTHLEPGSHAHWPDGLLDDTHFNCTGAAEVAGHVARELALICNKVAVA
ncbi:GDSL family lipase [Arthrobacter psychrolactophilus]|uniref:GDSL family lipase n=1 Tax=Arthrobacter psychrolactophilus TaxID=92442 RepID=A0A2V5ISS9_9MICC|nr:rhamnogalacturonan acetylesterase [Arthrobacter psychrolactophilus]PYI39051.1 GDSL family lipase [Arthrobacter psychrolactophilus]